MIQGLHFKRRCKGLGRSGGVVEGGWGVSRAQSRVQGLEAVESTTPLVDSGGGGGGGEGGPHCPNARPSACLPVWVGLPTSRPTDRCGHACRAERRAGQGKAGQGQGRAGQGQGGEDRPHIHPFTHLCARPCLLVPASVPRAPASVPRAPASVPCGLAAGALEPVPLPVPAPLPEPGPRQLQQGQGSSWCGSRGRGTWRAGVEGRA